MTDFNIRQLIRDVLRSSTMADPGEIAVEVMRRIPDSRVWEALAQVLRDAVRETMRSERTGNSFTVSDGEPAAKPKLTVTPQGSPYSAPSPEMNGPVERPRVPNRSPKVSAIRDGWQKRLHDRVHVGAGGGDWKLLKSCTYEDLIFAAKERHETADRNAAAARQYGAWARLITEHDVATFGDLPAEALISALGRAA